jgi:hypothetical protein
VAGVLTSSTPAPSPSQAVILLSWLTP